MKISDRIIKSRRGFELLKKLPPIHSLITSTHAHNPEIHLVLFPKNERSLDSDANNESFVRRIIKDDFSPSRIMPCISLPSIESENLNQEMSFYSDNGIECVLITENGLNDCRNHDDSSKYPDLATLSGEIKKISSDMKIIANINHLRLKTNTMLDQQISELRTQEHNGVDAIMTHTFDHKTFFDFADKCQENGVTIPIIPSIIPIGNPQYLFKSCINTNSDMPASLITTLFSGDGKITSTSSTIEDEHVEDRALRYNAKQIKYLSFDSSAINLHVADNIPFLNKLLEQAGLVKGEEREI